MTTTAVDIRALATPDDYRACVALQREVWGPAFEVVPAAILQVGTEVGGIAAGAFEANGQLAGFVFGLTGLDGAGNIIHWSHVLGVRPELRNAGLGRRLKDFQRCELARRNIGQMYWTYDPLIAKNAHFNLNVLGASVVRFVPNMYGHTGSLLHHGLPTDRLVVVIDTSRAPREVSPTLGADDACAPVLTARPQPGDQLASKGPKLAKHVRLEIPTDFAKLLAERPEEATVWHESIREHFLWALDNGYSVAGLRRDPATSRSYYLLEMRR